MTIAELILRLQRLDVDPDAQVLVCPEYYWPDTEEAGPPNADSVTQVAENLGDAFILTRT